MNCYILCPANCKSGGPELAHQLCAVINEFTSANAYMCYVNRILNLSDITSGIMDANVPADYLIYKTENVSLLAEIDMDENIVIIPEGLTGYISAFKNARKVLWWMSVNKYITSTHEIDLEIIKSEIELHLYQSYYALDYIKRKFPDVPKMYLSDYINEQHGRAFYPAEYRKNVVLYNPQKGYQNIIPFMQKIQWVQWEPIINKSIEEVIILMQTAKIYIDFGEHPGKDRIPREAAANGCCVITNRNGSAAYYKDVPIPEEYKFANPKRSIEEIEKLMLDICEHYEQHISNFSEYRLWIKKEKEIFKQDVIKFVQYIENNGT